MSLLFDEATHSYYDERGKLPSVTTVLASEGIISYPNSSEAAMNRGTSVHRACETVDRQVLGGDVTLELEGYVKAYKAYLDEAKPKWTLIEHPMAHPIYKYAGTLDRAFPLLDIKTGAPGSGCELQLGAYYDLLTSNGFKCEPEGRFLYLANDGSFKLEVVKGLNRLAKIFQAVLTTYQYKRKGKE